MSLDINQQFKNLVSAAQSVLVLIPENPSGDAVASAWALAFLLEKKNINVTVVFRDEFGEAKKLHFLGEPKKVADNIHGAQDFVLAFNTKYNKITDIRTETGEDEFRIYITPEKAGIDPRDFSFIPAKFKFDLMVILDSPDRESLGKIFEESPDIFYEVPMVNIDHHPENENFGQLNFVNLTAASTAEVLSEILESYAPESVDEKVANCLLAGIISATESFQKKTTTPKSLQLAARLMEKGADQQQISRYLFKTQPLGLLKLWGRVMLKINWEESLNLVWSIASLEDFIQSRTTPLDIPFVLEKIQDNYSSGKLFLVLYAETTGGTVGMLGPSDWSLAKKYSAQLGGTLKKNLVVFNIPESTPDKAIQLVKEKIKDIK